MPIKTQELKGIIHFHPSPQPFEKGHFIRKKGQRCQDFSSVLELFQRLLGNHSAASRKRISAWFSSEWAPEADWETDGNFRRSPSSHVYFVLRSVLMIDPKCWQVSSLLITKSFSFFVILLPEPGIEPGTPGWKTNVLSTTLWPLADESYLFWFFIYY